MGGAHLSAALPAHAATTAAILTLPGASASGHTVPPTGNVITGAGMATGRGSWRGRDQRTTHDREVGSAGLAISTNQPQTALVNWG